MPKVSQNDLIGKKTKAIPVPKTEIGIDIENKFPENIIEAAEVGQVDMSAIEAFTSIAQTRENIYSLIDTMSQDCTLSAVIQSYVEDTVEMNDKGQIVWCESSDGNVASYISYLIETLNIDKNIYSWANSLVKYGDVYLRLFKESDYKFDPIFGDEKEKEQLNEDIKVKVDLANDHYVHYVELVKNPGEMFELMKFGKTMGYIQAPINIQTYQDNEANSALAFMKYQLKRDDVNVYSATSFVHACLEDNSSRTAEEVNIFLNNSDYETNSNSVNYSVRRGQSILYNLFKIWRELSLLENSVLLNRLTKSSIIRLIQVEVGDMPKDKVQAHLQKIKSLVEQKAAINEGRGMSEYTNPGPMENNIYVPTHEGKGAITTAQVGGDVDPKQLTDLDWFNNKLFGSLGIPKAYFGFTDDGAGFNGGTSLTIISSKYGRAVKRIQNTLCQLITDLINILLIDKGLDRYVNKFTIRMQPPVTQEEKDRRENNDNRIRYIGDIMAQLSDISDPATKLKIIKSLLTPAINDPEVISLIENEIAKLEAQTTPENPTDENLDVSLEGGEENFDNLGGFESSVGEPLYDNESESTTEFTPETAPAATPETTSAATPDSGDSYLPSFAELGVENGTDANQI